MWDFAAYVLSEDQNVANNVAHSYIALTQGQESYMSQAAINLWRGDTEDSGDAREIYQYLRELRHPIFGLNPEVTRVDSKYQVYPAVVTATTSLSGKELAYSLNFPQKSVAGLPVIECTEFGRNIVTYDLDKKEDDKLHLGHIFHMNHEEKGVVTISKQSLASHTFITGSTGSGKSNTVYKILEEARKNDTNFLVIEPAKGEYKHIFGMDEDVSVYGTNPELTPMLRINPFSFPKGIHVLEHLDRLVEIFNVCWPMYAAMPAVLKSAIERSYASCDWDLNFSKNKYGEDIFPTFADVAIHVKQIIDSSEYDNENKGAYKGALLTRLESLTNGINGMIFVQDDIGASELYDKNVIVDLSRVGSSETKSMIMGMLVLKLQEYRMTTAEGINSPLKHITVLEEAHNLLRRTSSEQSSESANLLGKSVEMLANAIAEMRTFGEGFIIVDQAPRLLDLSTIRNTNTKIIMRLPDLSDRELVGRAANLNDDQITELAKLPCGVAAVYQNEWVQPVLCKVDKYMGEEKTFLFSPKQGADVYTQTNHVTTSLLDCIMNKEIFRKGDRADIQKLKDMVIRSKLDTSVKCDFIEYITSEKDNAIKSLRTLVYDFLEAGKAIVASKECNTISEWVHSVVNDLSPTIKDYSKRQIDLVVVLILYEQSLRDASYNDVLFRFTEIYQSEGGVF
jgi:DNA helicase HerA-like ATPase